MNTVLNAIISVHQSALLTIPLHFSLQLTSNLAGNESSFLILIYQFLPSIAITVLNVFIPFMFEKIVLAEDYSPEFEIKITIARYGIISYKFINGKIISYWKWTWLLNMTAKKIGFEIKVCTCMKPGSFHIGFKDLSFVYIAKKWALKERSTHAPKPGSFA